MGLEKRTQFETRSKLILSNAAVDLKPVDIIPRRIYIKLEFWMPKHGSLALQFHAYVSEAKVNTKNRAM